MIKAEIVIMTSEILLSEIYNLKKINWDVIILDMREMSKGNSLKLLSSLSHFTMCPHFALSYEILQSKFALNQYVKFLNITVSNLLTYSFINNNYNNITYILR